MTSQMLNTPRLAGFALALAMLLVPFTGVAQAQHTLVLGTVSGTVGSQATVDFTWTPTGNISLSGDFTMGFDSSALAFQKMELGPAYSSIGGASVSTSAVSGGVFVTFFHQSPGTAVNAGIVLRATFTVLAGASAANSVSVLTPNFADFQTGGAVDITSQVAVTNGAVTLPSPPTVSTIAYSATSITSTTALPVRITVTFSEAIKSSAPVPTVSFTKVTGTGSAPGSLNLQAVAGSQTQFFADLNPTFSNNGTFTLTFSATDVNDGLTLQAQPTTNNQISIDLEVPPDSVAPTATISISPATVTAAGNVTITAVFSDNNTPVLQATPTISISGPLASLNRSNQTMTAGANATTFTFTLAVPSQAGVNGTYQISLSAKDAAGNDLGTVSGPTSFTVAISGLPSVTARASANASVSGPGLIALDGSASTFSGTGVTAVTYSWAKVSGPAEASPGSFNSTKVNSRAFFNARTGGTYIFRLTVSSVGVTPAVTASADATVQILDLAPVAVAPQVVYRRLAASPTTATTDITLDAGHSFDPNGDSVAYVWTTTLTSIVLTNTTSSQATATVQVGVAKVQGDVRVTATANGKSSTADVFVVAAARGLPRASAGIDQTVTTTRSQIAVQLFGRDSFDPDNRSEDPATDLSFKWELESFVNTSGAQVAGTATFDSSTSVDPKVTLSTAGTYLFHLTVTTKDSTALSSVAHVRVKLVRQTNGLARAAIAVSSSDGSTVTSAASAAAGRLTTQHTLTLQPSESAVVTLNGSATGGGTGAVTYNWFLLGVESGDPVQLTTTSGSTTSIVIPGSVAGTLDAILQVSRGGTQGLGARVRLSVARTNNSPPRITAAVATSGGVSVSGNTTGSAQISSGGALPSITIAITAADNETASSALSYSIDQLVQSELTAEFTALGLDPTSPILGNVGGTTPRLEAFAQGDVTATFSGGTASFTFTPRPADAAPGAAGNAEAVGGAYVFEVSAEDASGAEDTRIITVFVVDQRAAGRGLLALGLPAGASFAEGEAGGVINLSTTLGSGNTLVLDLTGTIDRKTGAAVSDSNGAPVAGFGGFIHWSQVSGPSDFASDLTEINLSNGGQGSFKVTLAGAAAGEYVFRALFDNGDAQDQTTFAATAASSSAAGGGVSSDGDGGGLCALSRTDGAMGARAVDFLVFLLPLALVLGRRRFRLEGVRTR